MTVPRYRDAMLNILGPLNIGSPGIFSGGARWLHDQVKEHNLTPDQTLALIYRETENTQKASVRRLLDVVAGDEGLKAALRGAIFRDRDFPGALQSLMTGTGAGALTGA